MAVPALQKAGVCAGSAPALPVRRVRDARCLYGARRAPVLREADAVHDVAGMVEYLACIHWP